MTHTELPWTLAGTGIWSDNARICDYERNGHSEFYRQLDRDEQRSNAEFIIRAVNNHYQLIRALEDAAKVLPVGIELHAVLEALSRARGEAE